MEQYLIDLIGLRLNAEQMCGEFKKANYFKKIKGLKSLQVETDVFRTQASIYDGTFCEYS